MNASFIYISVVPPKDIIDPKFLPKPGFKPKPPAIGESRKASVSLRGKVLSLFSSIRI